ncbi:hypothetical protein HF086_013042 [Spodoptera exigua]|uniref:Uncharacterized protein n=1 Tax=Spodoptera exigua TaxID=7107 RepID=A0A922MEB8_SPOEX|nr:hypothetical protein HF086_013042 [Spodoptera exigua]
MHFICTRRHLKAYKIEDILTNLGLYEHMNTRGAQLSGGQRKRLSIALELINNPLIMFLDEPTTGLDSSSCSQVVQLCQTLAHQGRTIVCTVHQPSASLFALFDQVYVLAAGRFIELSCGEYGQDKIDLMANKSENGKALDWFDDHQSIPSMEGLRKLVPLSVLRDTEPTGGDEETSQSNQLSVLMRRGFLKAKRDATMTHLRLIVNVVVGIMLGSLFINAGNEVPNEMSILSKEHFNRWYSLGSYYISITIVDLPVSIIGCAVFSVIVYTMSSQPLDIVRFSMFFAISLYTVLVAQSFGLMIGAVFSVVNGTFLGPTLSVPMMMFAGFGVTLRDLPSYLRWGSYISYLRYGLEGFIGAIYGLDRPILDCNEALYCHYKHPRTFLNEVAMSPDEFWWDVLALSVFVVTLRIAAFILLKWKLDAVR